MKLKTAALIASIGSGLSLLLQTINFIRFNILERSDYYTIENDIYSIIYILCSASLFVFLIVFYQKQNSKSWKD